MSLLYITSNFVFYFENLFSIPYLYSCLFVKYSAKNPPSVNTNFSKCLFYVALLTIFSSTVNSLTNV